MEDQIVLPPKSKKKKHKRVKLSFPEYFSAIVIGSLLITLFLFLLSAFFINLTRRSMETNSSANTQATQKSETWLTYKYDNFSFKYPDTWANITMHTYSTTTEINVNDKLIFQDGVYYNQELQRDLTIDEFVEFNTPSEEAKVEDYLLDNVEGKIITYKKGDVFNNLIVIPTGSDNLLTITFETSTNPSDNSTINSILSSFKFTSDECGTCPNYVAPAEGWCENGTIVPGDKDECGCQLPPTCQPSQVSI